MRDFSWNVFAQTGDIEAYLLFKQCESLECGGQKLEEEEIKEFGSVTLESVKPTL